MNRTIRTPDVREAFFAALAANGGNVSRAAAAIDVDRSTLYDWQDDDPEFAADWEKAVRRGGHVLVDEAMRRSIEGVDEPVFYLGKQATDANGVPIAVKKYSDTLLIVMLKMRGLFVDKTQTAVTGADGGPVQVVQYALPSNGRDANSGS